MTITPYLSPSSASEQVTSIPILTAGTTKTSIISVELPDVAEGDILVCLAEFEGTNPESYNVGVWSALLLAAALDATTGVELSEFNGANITPGNHHMTFVKTAMHVVTASDVTAGRRFVNLVGYARSTAAQPGDVLVIEQDYGRGNVLLVRQ